MSMTTVDKVLITLPFVWRLERLQEITFFHFVLGRIESWMCCRKHDCCQSICLERSEKATRDPRRDRWRRRRTYFLTKMSVFWVVAIDLMMESARTSETLVNFYQTTRRYNPRRQPSSYSPPWEPQILQHTFWVQDQPNVPLLSYCTTENTWYRRSQSVDRELLHSSGSRNWDYKINYVKVNVSRYTSCRRLGGEEVGSYSFSTSALDGGEWSASRPGRPLPPGKGFPVPIG
jgi:hypothetical protein